MTTEQILDKIRELCGLKRIDSHYFKGNNLRCSNCGATAQEEYDGKKCNKIIGLPVHLEHLLMAIEKNHGTVSIQSNGLMQCTFTKYGGTSGNIIAVLQEEKSISYNFNKSVEQNLTDNPELRALVADLLK